MNTLLFFYGVFGANLGLAIIMVTVILRAALFPFMKSQFESSRKLRELQPQLKKLQKKHSRNPKKAQEEQMKLYRKVGYNPLGCFFSMIVPFPFLIAIYQAIRAFSTTENIADIEGVYTIVENFLANVLGPGWDGIMNTMFLWIDLSDSYNSLTSSYLQPTMQALPYLAIALLVGISQYFSVKFNQGLMGVTSGTDDKKKDDKSKGKKKGKKSEEPGMGDMMGQMNKSMMFTLPAMTTFIALSLPAAVSLYWILQSWIPVIMYSLYNRIKNGKNGENGGIKKPDFKKLVVGKKE